MSASARHQQSGVDHQSALLREMTSWSSLRVRVRYDQTLHVPRPDGRAGGGGGIDHDYIETALGQRLFEIRMSVEGGSVARQCGYSDGRRFARVDFHRDKRGDRARTIGIANSFMSEASEGYVQRPHPLRFLYVGLKPLYEVLADTKPYGEASHLDRTCDLFRFTVAGPSRTQDLIYWLDRRTSIPLRVEAYPVGGSPGDARPFWRWEAHSLDTVQGYHLPLRSTYTSYQQQDDHATDRPSLVNRVEVQSVEFNKEYPASMFWPTFTPGAQVIDAVGNDGIYTVPDPNPPPPAGTIAAPAIEANPERGWSEALPTTATLLGLLVLVVGLTLWWRRR
jgi:hypothetical protein